MFTIFNSKLTTIFLDPNSSTNYNSVTDDEKVNVILSPSLYWVKKLSLPVNSVKDAKKLLPSLFEDTLPDGDYSYSVYKSGDEFFIFAYEDKLILDTLSQSGILFSNVKNVYFAQSELQDIKGALKINESQSIEVEHGIVILVPCCWMEESGELNLSDVTLSDHSVSLQQYSHIIDNSSLYKICAILLVLSFLIFSEYFITLKKTEHVLELKEELYEKYKLKSTTLQNVSMLKKYRDVHSRQIKIREYMSYILSLNLKNGEKLSKLSVKNGILSAEFIGISEAVASRIQAKMQSKKVQFETEMKNTRLHLEMML